MNSKASKLSIAYDQKFAEKSVESSMPSAL